MTSKYTRADAEKIAFDNPTTTAPLTPRNFKEMSRKDLFIWDTMPLRDLNNQIVSFKGWSVIITLTAKKDPERFKFKNGDYDITRDWENRHDRARLCYWFAKDSQSWIYGGRLMAEGVSPTAKEWAGTPILLENNVIEMYYTCVTPGATMAKVRGKIEADEKGVTLSGFDKVKKLFSADGIYYQTEDQNPGFNFRDPSPFIDPKDGKLYMLFEGNVAGDIGTHLIGESDMGYAPPNNYDAVGDSTYKVGCIGLAVATDGLVGDTWELLPPLVTAVGVNDQLERPHFVFKDDKYYLFTISHTFTGANGLRFPDGLYGFVSDDLQGDYFPFNGSGLVIGNPTAQPYQGYSMYAMQNLLVTSFVDNIPLGRNWRIGGCLAPTIQLRIKGTNTYVVDKLGYGYIPPTRKVV